MPTVAPGRFTLDGGRRTAFRTTWRRGRGDAPTLVGSLNLAALNLANALGAIAGAAVVSTGLSVLATSWAGLVLVLLGLATFSATVRRALVR